MKMRCFFGGKGKAKENIVLSKIGQTLSKLWLIFDNEKKYIKAGCFSTYSEEREKSILENKNFKDQFLIYKEN